jgi:HPt (histidine-containing phosphotransfer) domain-containing protein
LTANAYEADLRSSVQAGCDLHLAKPFTRTALIEAIRRLVATETPAAGAAAGNGAVHPADGEGALPSAQPAAQPGAQSGVPAGVPKALDVQAAIRRLGGDAALYRRLAEHAQVFLRDWPPHFTQACAEGQRVRAHRLAHDLKSIAATVGAHGLSEQASVLEQTLRAVDPPPPPELGEGGDGHLAGLAAAAQQPTELPLVLAQLEAYMAGTVPP